MERYLRLITGSLVIVSVVLAYFMPDKTYFIYLAGFAGLDVLQSAFTKTGLSIMLAEKLFKEDTPNTTLYLVYRFISGAVVILGVVLYLSTPVIFGWSTLWFLVIVAIVNIQSAFTNQCPLMITLRLIMKRDKTVPTAV